jgi:protein-S-isoprenylcysteine O-methyltransferase Ste14
MAQSTPLSLIVLDGVLDTTAFDFASRAFLPFFFVAYIGLAYVFQVASFKRKYGVDPTSDRDPDPVMRLGETYRNVITLVIVLVVLAYAIHPRLVDYLGPIRFMEAPFVRLAGTVLLLASLVLIRLAQNQMRASWRVGLDPDNAPTELITTGLYARSRNPIYLAMTVTAAGLFLYLPNAVTFAIGNLTFVLLQIRTRVEEKHLRAAHGDAYASYHRRTPRWLFTRR